MSAPIRPFETNFVSKDWHTNSLSKMLSADIKKIRGLTTRDIQYNGILHTKSPALVLANAVDVQMQDAVAAVYVHESLIHVWLKTIPINMPLHPDPFYVYNGYKTALQPVMDLIEADKKNRDGSVRDFQHLVLKPMSRVLAFEYTEGMSKAQYYQRV